VRPLAHRGNMPAIFEESLTDAECDLHLRNAKLDRRRAHCLQHLFTVFRHDLTVIRLQMSAKVKLDCRHPPSCTEARNDRRRILCSPCTKHSDHRPGKWDEHSWHLQSPGGRLASLPYWERRRRMALTGCFSPRIYSGTADRLWMTTSVWSDSKSERLVFGLDTAAVCPLSCKSKLTHRRHRGPMAGAKIFENSALRFARLKLEHRLQ